MRIASGVTDQYCYFIGVDATDFTTRETGLSSFTVYRSRNGGAATAMTTPTINEVDSTNMPGVYELLLDEDMTLDSGDETQEMAFHITHAGMAPVTRTIELYRPKFTAGSTLSLADINSEVDTAISDASLATAASLATVDTNVDAILVDTGTTIPASISALNDLDAAGVRSAVGLASANLDTQLSTIDTVADGIQTDLSNGTDGLGAIKTAVDAISLTSADIADAVWDEAIAGHLTAGSTGASLNAAGGSGDPWVTSLPGSYTTGQAGKILADILTDTADLQANQGDWATATGFATSAALATVDANVDAILVDTGTTIPGLVASLNDIDAAGVRTAVGLSSANLDTQIAALPTATENADALLNRDMSAVSDTNARSPLNALRFLRNKYEVVGTTLTVYEEDDSTSAWTASLTANASADPITGSDPA